MSGPLRNPQWGNEAFALRYKQVDSLRQYFSTLKEINKDSLYEVAITLPSRKTISLRIILGPEFPYQAPSLQIMPAVSHRFVNEQMYVLPQMHEKLASWSVHTNLGKTVFEISQKLIQDQPQVLGTSINSYGGSYPNAGEPPPPYGMYGNTSTPSTPANNPSRPPTASPSSSISSSSVSSSSPTPSQQIRTPAIPSSFPELDQKSIVELNELLQNDDQFQALFDSLEVVKTMRQLRDDMRDGNEELAKKNVERTAELDALNQALNSKKETLQQLQAAVRGQQERQRDVQARLSPAVLLDRLVEAAQVAEAESDEIAVTYLDSSASDDHKEFIKKFTEKRKLYHLRAAKKESTLMSLNQKRQ